MPESTKDDKISLLPLRAKVVPSSTRSSATFPSGNAILDDPDHEYESRACRPTTATKAFHPLRRFSATRAQKLGVILASLLGVLVFCYFVYSVGYHSRRTEYILVDGTASHPWVKPDNFKIIGIVFYGRRRYVDILDCYLKQNLAVNGGYLDEVHFVVNTEDQDDRMWLDALISTSENYKKIDHPKTEDFLDLWKYAKEKHTMYIKIDDDMVYIHEDAIPRLVHSLLGHPDAIAVAANLINSPVTSWLHWHTNAVDAYLPDLETPSGPPSDWHASSLPPYPSQLKEHYDVAAHTYPVGHRWLPLPTTYKTLALTPMSHVAYDAFGVQLKSWAMGAQEHYSLLSNIESGRLQRYWFGGGDGIWNMWYEHYNINMLAVWGHIIADNKMSPERHDEWNLSEFLPRKLSMPLMVDTHALAAHFAFEPQHAGMAKTDLLDRYRLLANEMVCAEDNQKLPMELRT